MHRKSARPEEVLAKCYRLTNSSRTVSVDVVPTDALIVLVVAIALCASRCAGLHAKIRKREAVGIVVVLNDCRSACVMVDKQDVALSVAVEVR